MFLEENGEERLANVARNQRKKSMRGEIRIVPLRSSGEDLKTKQQNKPRLGVSCWAKDLCKAHKADLKVFYLTECSISQTNKNQMSNIYKKA